MPMGVPGDTVVASEGAPSGAADTDTAPSPAARTTERRWRLRRPGRFGLALLAIAVAAFGVRATYVLSTRDDISLCQRLVCGDAHYYVSQAATLADGHGFVDPTLREQTADHPPLTALAMAPVARLAPDPWTAVLAQRLAMAALGSLVVVGVGLLARRVGRRSRPELVGLLAAGIAAVNANFWMNDVLVMSETLATLSVVGVLLAVYRFIDHPTLARAAAVGAIVGVAGLVRAELLLLGPLTFVPMALRSDLVRHRWRDRVAAMVVAGAVATAVLVPWTAHNLVRFDEPVLLSTNDGLTLAGANCDQMYGLSGAGGIGFWSLGCAFVHESQIPADADQSVRSRIYRTIALGYAREHADRLRGVVEHRLLRGWGVFAPNEMVYLNAREGRAPWASWLGFAQWWLLIVPALVGIRVLRRRREPVWPLASTALAVTITIAVFYGLVRFRLPADVAAVVLAAVALEVLGRRLAQRRWGALVGEAPAVPATRARSEPGSNGHTPPASDLDPLLPAHEPVPASAERRADGHFPCLDAYRGIGMTMVLLNHAAYSTGFQHRTDGVAGVLTPIIGRLDLSVPMFFVLSGFLLFRPFARAVLTGGSLPDTRRFYRRRILRIVPSYWVALAGVGLLFGLRIPGVIDWLGNAVFAPAFGAPLQACQPNGSCQVAYGLTPAWSIGVEVAFYLSLPLAAFGLLRLTRRRAAGPSGRGSGEPDRYRPMLAGLAALYLTGTGFRVFVVMAEPSWAEQALLWLPMFFDVFAIGMALAVISAASAGGRPLPRLAAWAGRHPVACWAVAGAIFLFMTRLPYPERPFGLRDASGFSDYLVRQFLYGIASAAWLAPALFGDQHEGRLRRVLSSRPLVYLGTISLSFYLWHLPLIEKVKQWTVSDWDVRAQAAANASAANPLASAATFAGSYPRVVLISWVLSFIVASVLYRVVELPFLRLKDQPLRTLWQRRRH